jgi:DNA-binding response OmpR family regulator
MSAILLIIPDQALRDAVAEQIVAAKIAAPWQACSAREVTEAVRPSVLIIDEAAFVKKDLDALNLGDEKPALLVLGTGEDADGVTESFAKPFRLGHLVTRLRYYLETAPLLRERSLTVGRYRLEPQNRRLICASGEPIRLTEKETALLVFLAQRATPASRRDMLAEIWGYDERIDTRTLETHIYQLRRKLDKDGENWLINEAGAYRLAKG